MRKLAITYGGDNRELLNNFPMVTPPCGIVLDPFAGTGTTGEAAILEGYAVRLLEREEEYLQDIERRMRGLQKYE